MQNLADIVLSKEKKKKIKNQYTHKRLTIFLEKKTLKFTF